MPNIAHIFSKVHHGVHKLFRDGGQKQPSPKVLVATPASSTTTDEGLPSPLVALAEKLLLAAKSLELTPQNPHGDKAGRMAIAKMAKKIHLEASGAEGILPMYATTFGEIGATYMFMEWKLFDKIPHTEDGISFKDLADSIGAPEAVISRLGGMLVATGRLIHTQTGRVRHSHTSVLFKAEHPVGNLFRIMLEHGLRGYIRWPEYFAKYGVVEPSGPTHNPFTFSWGYPEMSVFDVVAMDPERARIFAGAMRSTYSISATSGGPAHLYDFGWLAATAARDGYEEEAGSRSRGLPPPPLIVDVGGSHGHTLAHILKTFPEIPQERCMLQDRADVIKESRKDPSAALTGIQRVAHDFMTEQPAEGQGAKIYLLRRVLHDYTDQICVSILTHLAAALPRADSRARVLIMDQIMSDPPTPGNAAADMVMFNIGGKERSAAGFEKIVGEAGMRTVQIHKKEGNDMGVVECALST